MSQFLLCPALCANASQLLLVHTSSSRPVPVGRAHVNGADWIALFRRGVQLLGHCWRTVRLKDCVLGVIRLLLGSILMKVAGAGPEAAELLAKIR